jgi:uncharacterized lipoprotein NlpE involved in copper resistance
MKFKFAGFITATALALTLIGCNQTANENTTANNRAPVTNVNSPAPVVSSNVNANTNSRRPPTREEYERDKERYRREAKESGRTIGTGLNDGWLWVKTKFDLAAADDLRDSTINVDVENGVVTLTGTVASPAQKSRGEAVAKSVEGVKSVKNLLKVAPSNSNSGNANKANSNRRR